MLTSYSGTYKTWIFSHQDEKGVPIGRVIDFVINPENGHFEAIWAQSSHGLRLLSIKDIIRWDEQELVINSEKDFLKAEDFPRLQPILEKEVALLGTKVFSETQQYLGRVKDFAFDTISPKILSLLVQNGWWFIGKKSIIPRNKIIKIASTGIYISENVIPITPTKGAKVDSQSEKVRLES